MKEDTNNTNENQDLKVKRQDANTCIGVGAGLGVMGTAAALVTGATCPLCFIVAPGLVGIGSYLHWQAKKESNKMAPILPNEEKRQK